MENFFQAHSCGCCKGHFLAGCWPDVWVCLFVCFTTWASPQGCSNILIPWHLASLEQVIRENEREWLVQDGSCMRLVAQVEHRRQPHKDVSMRKRGHLGDWQPHSLPFKFISRPSCQGDIPGALSLPGCHLPVPCSPLSGPLLWDVARHSRITCLPL